PGPRRQATGLLHNIAGRATALGGSCLPHIPASDGYRAAARGDELVDTLQQRRLTATGSAQQDRDLAAGSFEGEPLHGGRILSRILHGDVAKSNHATRAYRPTGRHAADWSGFSGKTGSASAAPSRAASCGSSGTPSTGSARAGPGTSNPPHPNHRGFLPGWRA